MKIFSDIISNKYYLFCALLLYTLFTAFFIQDILLPNFFPDGINSHGLLKNTDSIKYHEQAILVSDRINLFGWQEWELLPATLNANGEPLSDRHFIVGLTALFYALIAPEPWVMIPINAFFHVLTVFVLIKIALLFTDKYYLALLSVTPYMFFPSACFWYSQLLKDVYFNLGAVMFCYGWMHVGFVNKIQAMKVSNILIGPFFILFGYILMGCIRPFNFSLLILESLLIIIFLLIFLLFYIINKKINFKYLTKIAFMSLLVLFLLTRIENIFINNNLVSKEVISFDYVAPFTKDGKLHFHNTEKNKLLWRRNEWIPISLDVKFSSLARMRKVVSDNYLQNKVAKSTVDMNIQFSSTIDILKYIPRAVQIAFFSPFPKHWFEAGSSKSATVMRKIAMLEMLFIYITFLFIPLAFYYWKNKPELWVSIIYCSSMMTLFTIAIPNVGSLYRYRYPYLMILITILVISGYKFIYKIFFTKSEI